MTKIAQCMSCSRGSNYEECEHFNHSSDEDCSSYVFPFNNSKGMFKRVLSFKGRIRRLEFGFIAIIYWIYILPLYILNENEMSDAFIIIWLFLLIPVLWIRLAEGTKRCHDKDCSGWNQIIPFYVFVMLFEDGEESPNKYGTSPKKNYDSQIYTKE